MRLKLCLTLVSAAALALLAACGAKTKADPADEAPPPAKVNELGSPDIVHVDHAERFPLVTAGQREDIPQVEATGVINPDVERSVPVISLAAGRVVEIDAKLGDDVRKGQLLLKVLSNDVAAAFQTYRQAQADNALAQKQLERAKLLYDHGAISLNDLQVAEDAAEKAGVAVETSAQQLQTLGADLNHPDPVIRILAPVSGTIVEQNVVLSASVHTPDNQSNLFTIADLSRVWVICDVYENDLPSVRLGDRADIRLDAYPDLVFHGRVNNIGKVLDPNLRSAKVRIQLSNPGQMRAGMFVRAVFSGLHGRVYPTVPAAAVLHLHDRDWVFVPQTGSEFRRVQVTSGKVVNGQQEIVSGLSPGQQIVADPLAVDSESQQ